MREVEATVGIDTLEGKGKPMNGQVRISQSDSGVIIEIMPDGENGLCAWASVALREWFALLEG